MQQPIVGAVGIDFGSLRSVIAVAKRGGVDILANEASNRETPNCIGFGDNERYMGELGAQQAKSNFKNTCTFFNRLLGISKDYPYLKQETKWISSKVAQNQKEQLVFEVNYQGQKTQLLPEQLTAAMLGKLRQIIRKANISDKECVISVPSYLTEIERKALKEAARIAELNVIRLFNESSAISLSYGLFRRSELGDNANLRNVVFIDIGHSKISAFVSAFSKEKASIIAQVHDRHLGCRDIDWVMLEYYAKMFEKQSNGLSVYENKKSILRLIDAIEKQRKVLSANSEGSIHCEYLMEDCDLNHNLSRPEFEKLIQPLLGKIELLLNQLNSEIIEKKIKIHSVEIIGGGSRIPIIQELIKNVFKVDQIQKTLNATECIARGCAMMSAIISPQFKVADYNLEECNYYPINVSWSFFKGEGGMDIEKQQSKSSKIFDKGCSLPNLKSLTFNKNDGILLNLTYNPAPEGFNENLATYKILPCSPKEPDYKLIIKIQLNTDGLVQLNEAQLQEKFIVEEKVEKKKEKKPEPQQQPANQQQPSPNTGNQAPQDPNSQQQQQQPTQQQTSANSQEQQQGQVDPQQQNQNANNQPNANAQANAKPEEMKEEIEYEIKKKEKTRYQDLKFEYQPLYQLNQKEFDDLFHLEATMSNQDRLTQETLHKKNELETFIYQWREKVTSSLKEYTPQELIPEIQKKLENVDAWLYEEGKSTSKSKYQEQIDNLRKLCDPIQKRYEEYQNLPKIIQEVTTQINDYQQFVDSKDIKYEHILPEEREKVRIECNTLIQWLNDMNTKQNQLKRCQDPVIHSDEIKNKLENLKKICYPIVSKPKPEPPKVEPKKEETKIEQEQPQQQTQANGQPNADQGKAAAPEQKNDGMDIENPPLENKK